MTDHKQQMIAMAAILTTLAETREARSGTVYAALMAHGISHGEFCTLQTILASQGLISVDGTLLRITLKGDKMAALLNEAVAA